MKKVTLILILLYVNCANIKGYQARYWYAEYLPVGNFTTQMIDENHMQVLIDFPDSDFSIISVPDYPNQWIGVKSVGEHDWMISQNGLHYNIPTSGFHVILPANRKLESFEYDTLGLHLFAVDFTPACNGVAVDSTFPFVTYKGSWDFKPLHMEQFTYAPFFYDSNNKKIWLVSKILIKMILAPAEKYTYTKDNLNRALTICRQPWWRTINITDINTFYPEIYAGIETLETGKQSYLRIRSKNELEGSVSETTQKAYIEIRNGLGQHVRSVAVSERGKFSINLGSENVSPGFYLCTLVADGKRIGTTKIIVEP